MFQKIISFIKPTDTKLIYKNGKVNVLNYEKINIFDNDKIQLKCFERIITIKGQDLIITRLFNDELLIEGIINNILFEDFND